MDKKQYIELKFKIVYIMKEVNGGSGWDLKDFLFEGGRSQTWDNIARWTEGIFNLHEEFSWKYLSEDNENRRKKYLRKIGTINLKKTPGKHTSIYKEISTAATKNRIIIKQQIELYDPEIIICCGTSSDFIKCYSESNYVNWAMMRRGVEYVRNKNQIIVSFVHPEARVRDAYLYYALVDGIREIIGYSS
ncbi:hypothetical protein [Facklamia sp. P12950]|uniref:hypothetical protein n=1 Tax=Facklamia sp. P12950 TaxID=3421951 RepID=UPI003D17293A